MGPAEERDGCRDVAARWRAGCAGGEDAGAGNGGEFELQAAGGSFSSGGGPQDLYERWARRSFAGCGFAFCDRPALRVEHGGWGAALAPEELTGRQANRSPSTQSQREMSTAITQELLARNRHVAASAHNLRVAIINPAPPSTPFSRPDGCHGASCRPYARAGEGARVDPDSRRDSATAFRFRPSAPPGTWGSSPPGVRDRQLGQPLGLPLPLLLLSIMARFFQLFQPFQPPVARA